ncbi:hypothetical protein [Parapedobacter lycopersici]|uniref:hypothetical protein n=1 Tax=Parapedobacter lycopersici TaxID=1864939 RepID=UPI0033422F97
MNRFNPYLLFALLLLPAVPLLAQSHNSNKDIDEAIRDISENARRIGMEASDAIRQIDIPALVKDAQQLARVSEVQRQEIRAQIEKIDVPALAEQARSLAAEATDMDWQHLWDQPFATAFAFQKEKRIEKSYPVTGSHSLHIDNRYGKVAVHNWDRNEIKITIRVRTAESSENRAQEALDRVSIDESKTGNRITLKTVIGSAESSNWWSMLTSGGNNRALNIDYEVYMPRQNALAVSNSYGAVELDDRDGQAHISVSYGSLAAGRLNARGNTLSIAYSRGDVAYVNEGEVSVRYGGFTLGEAERLTLALSYTSGSEIGLVNREADVSLKYSGGFEMGLGKNIQKANVAAAYSSVDINPAPGAAFNFNVAVSYGGFDYNDQHAYINSQSGGNTSKSYTGYWSKSGSNSVSISSRYGSVRLD